MAWIWRCCGVGQAAAPPIRPLAWELPCAMGAALKRKGKKKKKRKKVASVIKIVS